MKDLKKYAGKPIVIDEIDFYPLSLNDYVEINDETGVDVTKEMLRGGNPVEMFSSALIREILFRSIVRGEKSVTREQVGDLSLKGEDLGRALSYALNGTEPETGDGAGNAPEAQSTE
jgi:hypothetical protein